MSRRVAMLALGALLFAGCGGGGDTTTETGGSGATTADETTTFQAFFFRNAALVPVEVEVPQTEAVAASALGRLLFEPPQGHTTAIPEGTRLMRVAVSDGIATATFSRELGTPPARTAQAQIVSTLAQFPTVSGVEIEVEGVGAMPLADGSGEPLDRPATPEDYVDLTADALIFVRTPARDSTVTSPVTLSGTANVFEATFHIEIWSDGQLLDTEVVTATSGSGERGTWETTLDLPSGEVRLHLFEPSAEDGSALHPTEVLLTVR